MAWYPLAHKRPIAPGPNDPPVIIIGAILHVDAGNSPDLYDYFNGPSDGIESHFHVPKEGPVLQYRDTHYEADANLKGNSFFAEHPPKRFGYISIETQGLAKGEWNDHQIQNIKTVLKWASETHNFPLTRCASATSPGVGYHVMWGAPSAWTPYSKVCPGPDRVRQYEQVLVPWMKAGAPMGGAAVDGGNVTPEQMQDLKDFFEARLKAYTLDVKKYLRQTDDDDAQRAANATVTKLKETK